MILLSSTRREKVDGRHSQQLYPSVSFSFPSSTLRSRMWCSPHSKIQSDSLVVVFTSRRCPRVGTFHRLSHKHLAISHALPLNALPSPSVTCIRYSDFYAARRSFVFDTVISLRFCQHYHSSNDIACIRYSDFYAVQRSFVFDTVISLRLCQHHHSSNDWTLFYLIKRFLRSPTFTCISSWYSDLSAILGFRSLPASLSIRPSTLLRLIFFRS